MTMFSQLLRKGCKRFSSAWVICLCLLCNVAWADYKNDVGYTDLADDPGIIMPKGEGVIVTQVEAGESTGEYLPDTEASQFSGKTIADKSNVATGVSGHATAVGGYFYGSASMAPGVATIDVYEAVNWLTYSYYFSNCRLSAGFLAYGLPSSSCGDPRQPVYDPYDPDYPTIYRWPNCPPCTLSSPSRVANHSYVGDGTYTDLYRRVDYVTDRDEFIQIAAVNLNATQRPMISNAFNAVTVGRTDGVHPMDTVSIDSVYTAGRVCPLMVAPLSPTSYAAPLVSAAAALLVQTGRDPDLSTDPLETQTNDRSGNIILNAERSEVIKAALMAGARRVTYNGESSPQITDYRLASGRRSANGLDRKFGAGQLDVRNSYYIIAAGEQNSAEDQPVTGGAIADRGFDYDPRFGGLAESNRTAVYLFHEEAEQRHLYASLVWNLCIDGGSITDFDSSAVLYNLDLKLLDVTVDGWPREVAVSLSSNENTENIWAPLAPGRKYRLEVTVPAGQSDFLWDYGLAWRTAQPPDSDGDGIPDDWELVFGFDYTSSEDGNGDADLDGLVNSEEFIAGTDPNVADTDGDGQTDFEEIRAGSDPLNPYETVIGVDAIGTGLLCFLTGALLLIGIVLLKERGGKGDL